MSGELDIQRAKRIFDEAVELTPGERVAFLERVCAHDPNVHRQVRLMLLEFESSSTVTKEAFLDGPVASAKGEKFEGTERFLIVRQLGAGAFGTVYQAWDRVQQVTVAVKVLRNRKPELLFRFKREFRTLVDVQHSNLVRLYELFSEGEQWFFSMEILDGRHFLAHVRPDENKCSIDLLRPALFQLVQGVGRLHRANCLHRDLKPANAMVTDAGRVVVLDFGLVREFDFSAPEQSHTQVVGTPAYMAPEQILEGHVSEASDFYSIGVMLFQSLTGRLPFGGSPMQAWAHGDNTVPEPRQFEPETPSDLNELCRRLLHPRQEDRPKAAEVLRILSETPHHVTGANAVAYPPEVDRFVGRMVHLQQLQSAFAEAQEGRFKALLMSGRSGIGKTTLVKHFLGLLAERHPNLLVVRGRCYEFESVPYKGLDALVDELSRHLQRLPVARVEALLSRDAFLLPRLFPVLGRVTAIAAAPARSAIVPDAQELRQRTFAALRELLARLSDRQPLVVWIDDLQWGDRDSSTFLADLCAPPQQPPLLLILTYRSEELESNPTLQYLNDALFNPKTSGNLSQMLLDELSEEESKSLLKHLLPDGADDAHAQIIKEAAGHPLFLHELVRSASSRGAGLSSGLELRTVLQKRVSDLTPIAREVLEFLCIASQPLTQSIVFAAADSGSMEDRGETLALLIREKFARTTASGGVRRAEPFHDQVRAAVTEALAPEVRRARHARLATILSFQQDIEPQVLVTHYFQAGDMGAAHEAAVRAARIAEGQLAFDRAAVFYQAALEAGELDPERTSELNRRLADMLSLAGRGRDSANAYLKAAESSPQSAAFDLQRRAADQLMRSGHIDQALELFERLAAKVGVRVPSSPAEAIRRIALARLRTRIRLLFGIPRPRTDHPSADVLTRLELLRSAGMALVIADPVLAAYFQTRHIIEALRVREPMHLCIALALEGVARLASGKGNVAIPFELHRRAEELAENIGDPNTRGLIYLIRAHLDFLSCRIAEARQHSRRALEYLNEHCTGVAWERTSAYAILFWSMGWAGDVKQAREQLPQLLREESARGDATSLRLLGLVHIPFLSLDRPDDCIREVELALRANARKKNDLQHYGAVWELVDSYFYLGDYARARGCLLATWGGMGSAFARVWRTLMINRLYLAGRAALACWLENPMDAVLGAEVANYAKRLKRVGSPWCDPMSKVLRAGLAVGHGRRGDASRLLEEASEEFEKASLHAYAASARHFCGLIRGDEHGRRLMQSAAEFMKAQEVVNPEAFMRAHLPGKWVSTQHQNQS
jgi:tetratricopeptide (TPR) repeat protein